MLDVDTVLHFISSDLNRSSNSAHEIYRQFQMRHQMDYTDFVRSLERLFRDGYLDKRPGLNKEMTYLLTYEGKQFAKQGGYSGRPIKPGNLINPSTEGQNKTRFILIGISITIVALIILWLFTR